jgi:thiol:disulfide interchange protein DsbD
MAITYAIAGVVAALSGVLISAALQNPWVLGGFALVFVLLALSMFGFYELQMPNFIQSRFTEKANRVKGGNLAGVFVMGVLSAVIVGPCVAAPLAGALLYIGQTRDVWLGGAALYAMALGMGVPLLVVGVAGGALLPRAGAWMNGVKAFFGVMLLAVAIWLVSPVIPAAASMLLWATLLIVSAMYLSAIDPLPPNASGFRRFWKGVGVIALLVGAALLIGLLAGSRDVLQPLAGLRAAVPGAAAAGTHLAFEKVPASAFESRLAAARGKPVMVDFYADWCVSCKELERFTFSDPRVVARLSGVTLIQVDVTANDAADKALLKRFRLFGPPGVIFLDAQGVERGRVVGYEPPEKFLQSIDKFLK